MLVNWGRPELSQDLGPQEPRGAFEVFILEMVKVRNARQFREGGGRSTHRS